MNDLSIIGFGSFGRFMATHLRPHFNVRVADTRVMAAEEPARVDVVPVSIEAAAACPAIVLAVPVQNLEGLLARIAPMVAPDALVLDVSSVKLRPIELMRHHLPKARLIGTHPLFGPQSGANGVAGLPIAFCPVRCDATTVACVRGFLADTLGLRVVDTTPDEHDRQMAHVQGLTHLISRALSELAIPESPMATVAYQRLLAMRGNLQHDSLELFFTIERENPYAGAVRRAFLEKVAELERRIGDRSQGIE